jgi:molecular chaperone GrpE
MSVKRNQQEDYPLDGTGDGTGEAVSDQSAMDVAMEQRGHPLDNSSKTDDSESADKNQESAEDWEAQVAIQKDRMLRLHAEMENLRNRTARELADQRKYGCLPLLKDILPVIDNIDRAIESALQEDPLDENQLDVQEKGANSRLGPNGLLEGFQLVRQQLLSILEQHHCEPIDALGQPFDPQFHEAILQQPSAEQPKDHVLIVTQAGYRLYDRVVRASQVIISSGPAEK